MGIIKMLLLIIVLNLDFFFVSLGLGARNRRIEELPIISLIIACIQSLVPIIGFVLGSLLNSIIGIAGRYIGGILLVAAGFQILREYTKNPYMAMSGKSTLLVFAGACTEDLLASIGLGITMGKAIIFFILSFIMCYFMNLFAMKLGRSLRRLFNFPVDVFTGIILIFIGIASFFGIM